MALFLMSLCLVIMFAFFIANVFDSKNIVNNIIYFLLTAFANVVLTFEILSLFSKISISGVLLLNILSVSAALVLWVIKKRPVLIINFSEILKRLKTVLLSDKTLLILSIGFLFMCFVSLVLEIILPSIDAASIFYHVVRALFWIENGNLGHFIAADSRLLDFPINSEILYTWVLLFVKKDVGLSFFSLAGYVLFITSLFGLLSQFNFSIRRKLWIILIVSCFPSVITYISSTETNIIIAGLIVSCLYLYLNFIKKGNFVSIFMSALALALAVGTKTSAILCIPAIITWFGFVGVIYKKNVLKLMGVFTAFFTINFVLFASYNYILNYFDYGHFISSQSMTYAHQNLNGIKGFWFNLINYFFMMFKFPMVENVYPLSDNLININISLLKFLGIPPGFGVYSNESGGKIIDASRSGLGLLGILVFLPCVVISFLRLFRKQKINHRLINSFSVIFLISFLLMSYSLVYMSFNIRFIVTFALISSPVLYYSYTKKFTFYKFIVAVCAFCYLIYVPLNIMDKPFIQVMNLFKNGKTISQVRYLGYCSSYYEAENNDVNSGCFLRNFIRKFNKNNKILYFPQEGENLLVIKLLQFEGYDIDINLIENADKINFEKYNLVITLENRQASNLFNNADKIDGATYRGKDFYCYYNEADGDMALLNKVSKLYISYCRFDDFYFFNKLYRSDDVLIYKENIENQINEFKYNVYENLNNPVIK